MEFNCLETYSHFKEAVYFFSEILSTHLSTLEEWRAESTLEPPSGFKHGIAGLEIQHVNQ